MAKRDTGGLGGKGLDNIFNVNVEKFLDDIQNNAQDAPGRKEIEIPIGLPHRKAEGKRFSGGNRKEAIFLQRILL